MFEEAAKHTHVRAHSEIEMDLILRHKHTNNSAINTRAYLLRSTIKRGAASSSECGVNFYSRDPTAFTSAIAAGAICGSFQILNFEFRTGNATSFL
jgi:hypothetical protein